MTMRGLSMSLHAVLAGVICSLPAAAQQGRLLVVGQGDCGVAQVDYTRRLLDEVSAFDGSVLTEQDVANRLLVPVQANVGQIESQVDEALRQFRNGQFVAAKRAFEDARRLVDSLPPSTERQALFVGTAVRLGQVYRSLGLENEKSEIWRQLVRLQPDHRLDEDEFAPSLRNDFETVRQDVIKQPRSQVRITSTPPGANVWVGGFKMGKTPLTLSLTTPARYEVLLENGGQWSLRHLLSTPVRAELSVNLPVENALRGPGPCLAADARHPGQQRVRDAFTLGAIFEAERMIVVRLSRPPLKPIQLTATLYDVKAKKELRHGGLPAADVESGRGLQPGGLRDLSRYLITGSQEGQHLVVAPAESKGPDESAAPGAEPHAAEIAPDAGEDLQIQAQPSPKLRIGSYGAFGLCGAAVMTAAVVRVMAEPERQSLKERLLEGGSLNQDDPESFRLHDALVAKGHIATVALITAGASAATGAVLWWLSRDKPVETAVRPVEVGFGAGHDGAAVYVGGSF